MRTAVLKCFRHEIVHEVVHAFTSDIELLVPIKPEEGAQSRSLRQLHLRIVKSEAEELLLGSRRATQHIHGLAKEELRRAVKRELEEQRL